MLRLVLGAVALCCAALSFDAPHAQAAFGVQEQNFEAGTCVTSSCLYSSAPTAFFTQAAGHPPFGITTFEFNHHKGLLGEEPEGQVRNIRVDLPPGLAADPQALPQCPIASFNASSCPANTKVGENQLTVFDGAGNLTLPGTVYDLQQPPGLPLDFGIIVALEPLVNVHIFLEGHVSWNTDYHEYFEIRNVPREGEVLGVKVPLSVLKSKLIFNGNAGQGNFLTLPSVCSSTTTSFLEVESWEGQTSRTQTHTPVGVKGCEGVPFAPSATVTPETSQSDEPDGATTQLTVAQNPAARQINTADIRDVRLLLPEGMTLNPSAANGLQACTAGQIAIGTTEPVTCPAASKVGTIGIETDLPPGSLAGNVYLASPGGGPITGPPYTLYVDAESALGVSLRLKGLVEPNPSTGQLEVTFTENPQLPFSSLALKLDGGALAPVANRLLCGNSPSNAVFTPYTGTSAWLSANPFTTTGCASSPPPFALAQSTSDSSANAGAFTNYTFTLSRGDGQQYLQRVSATLPAGLLGAIPSVPLCPEPLAAQGSCPASSQIGTATVAAGSGPEPYTFSGSVSLTGPYGGAPYGLSIAVPAVAGPFNLGTVVTRAAIGIGLYSARVTATAVLPTIFKGVPLRLRSVSVAVNRAGFLFNPTSCGPLATESALDSTMNGSQNVSSPLAIAGCGGLSFKPALSLSTGAHATKANGASIETRITQGAHQANIREALITLPKQLPARLTTLQKACPVAQFEAGPPPGTCPSTAQVGSATVATPVLPDKLTGPAYLVSRGGAGFPDLDLVLRADGVEVVLVGHTQIKSGVISSKFETLPDAPISSAVVTLPVGPRSLLSANANLCRASLAAATTLIAQSGAKTNAKTKIAVSGCPVEIIAHRTTGNRAIITVLAPAAGRLSLSGRDMHTLFKRTSKAGRMTLTVHLTSRGIQRAQRSRRLRLKLRVGFVPHTGHGNSKASATLTFHG